MTYQDSRAFLAIGISQNTINPTTFGYEKLCSRCMSHNLTKARKRTASLAYHSRRDLKFDRNIYTFYKVFRIEVVDKHTTYSVDASRPAPHVTVPNNVIIFFPDKVKWTQLLVDAINLDRTQPDVEDDLEVSDNDNEIKSKTNDNIFNDAYKIKAE
ncbi:hypothetical protein EVAR_98130_1 [Eumeta japonica]|uniref:Uncharacterized protein n=1 Tax=Eumeta variegata TaxID=151549 RepID=A0A4C1XTJ4_EUMVA|nr:hypothetical protein EVAR_98130_1 [Eumeta japonica]